MASGYVSMLTHHRAREPLKLSVVINIHTEHVLERGLLALPPRMVGGEGDLSFI